MFLFQYPSIFPLNQIKPQPPIIKGELQETYSSPFIVKKSPILCILFTVLHKKITFLSKSLRYSVVALLLVLFHTTGGEDGVFCLVDFLHFLCGGVFHLFA